MSGRTRRISASWVASAVALAVVLAPACAGADEPSEGTEAGEPAEAGPDPALRKRSAESLLAEGRKLAKERKWADALPVFQEAYHKRNTSYNIVGNLGIVEHELEMWKPAAQHLSEAIRLFPVGGPPIQQEALQKRLEDAKRRLVTVSVQVSPDVACVRLGDEERCGVALREPMFALPGAIVVEVTAPGHEPLRREETGAAGERLSLRLSLSPVAAEPVAPPPAPAEPSATLMPAWPGYVFIGLGLVGVATGGILMSQAGGSDDSAAEQLATLRADTGQAAPCATPISPEVAGVCDSIADDLGQHDTFFNAGLGTMLGGAGLLVAGGVMLGLSFVEAEGDQAVWVAPRLSAGEAGLLIRGSW